MQLSMLKTQTLMRGISSPMSSTGKLLSSMAWESSQRTLRYSVKSTGLCSSCLASSIWSCFLIYSLLSLVTSSRLSTTKPLSTATERRQFRCLLCKTLSSVTEPRTLTPTSFSLSPRSSLRRKSSKKTPLTRSMNWIRSLSLRSIPSRVTCRISWSPSSLSLLRTSLTRSTAKDRTPRVERKRRSTGRQRNLLSLRGKRERTVECLRSPTCHRLKWWNLTLPSTGQSLWKLSVKVNQAPRMSLRKGIDPGLRWISC